MVFDGALDSDQVTAIKQLLRDKVPIVRAGTVEGDSIKAEEVNNVLMGSETIAGLQSVHSALDKAASASADTAVWIVGNGPQSIDPYDKAVDLSGTTIRSIGSATLQHNDSQSGWLLYPQNGGDELSLDLRIDPNGRRGVTIPDGSQDVSATVRCFGHDAFDAYVRLTGSETYENLDLNLNITGVGNAIGAKLNAPVKRCTIEGSFKNIATAVSDTNYSHSNLTTDLVVEDCEGIIFGTNTINQADIRIKGQNVDTALVKCSPNDCAIHAVGTCNDRGIYLKGGRDSLITGSMEDGSEAGVDIESQGSAGHGDTDATKHTVTVQVSNFGGSGIILRDATFCTIKGCECNQNSNGDAGAQSGIRLIDTSDNNGCLNNTIIGNVCVDTHSTQTQSYGIQTQQNADYNTIIGNDVSKNLNGGLDLVGSNNVVANNQTNTSL